MNYTLDTPGATTPVTPTTAAAETGESAALLEKRRRVIRDIRAHNPTAGLEFLAGFTTEDLTDYLDHLRHAREKHIRLPGWVQRRAAKLEAARQLLRKVA